MVCAILLWDLRLSWNNSEIRYHAFFRTRVIQFDKIKYATMNESARKRYSPPFTLILLSTSPMTKDLRINLKLFSNRTLNEFRDVLISRGIAMVK